MTGTKYTYKANTTVTILQNISSNIDKVRVNVTGRIAYINTSNYTTSGGSNSTNSTVGQYKRLKNRTYLYSNSSLTGTRYTYLPLTQVRIVKNVSSTVDYVYVVKTNDSMIDPSLEWITIERFSKIPFYHEKIRQAMLNHMPSEHEIEDVILIEDAD